jgi:hypothetical protein
MNDIYIEVSHDVFNQVISEALDSYRESDEHWRLSTDAPLLYKDNPLRKFVEGTPAYSLFNNNVPAKYSFYLAFDTFITHTITE